MITLHYNITINPQIYLNYFCFICVSTNRLLEVQIQYKCPLMFERFVYFQYSFIKIFLTFHQFSLGYDDQTLTWLWFLIKSLFFPLSAAQIYFKFWINFYLCTRYYKHIKSQPNVATNWFSLSTVSQCSHEETNFQTE